MEAGFTLLPLFIFLAIIEVGQTIYLNSASIQPKRILVDDENSPAPPVNFRKVSGEANHITLSMFGGLQIHFNSRGIDAQ